jgi:hypothetical protein
VARDRPAGCSSGYRDEKCAARAEQPISVRTWAKALSSIDDCHDGRPPDLHSAGGLDRQISIALTSNVICKSSDVLFLFR